MGGAVGLQGALAAAGIAAGALASGLTILTTGAIAGGLIAIAAQAEGVQNAFKDMGTHVTDTMKNLTQPLQEPLIRFAATASRAFDSLGPPIQAIVGQLAPLIDQIGGKLEPLALRVGPMLQSMFEAGIGPLNAFLDGLGPLSDRMGEFFNILKNPVVTEFTTTLMTSIGSLLPPLGQLMVALTPLGTQALPVLVNAFTQLSNWMISTGIPTIQQMATDVWPTLQAVLQTVGGIITGTVIPALTTMTGFIRDNSTLVQNLVIAFLAIKVAVIAFNGVMILFNGLMAAARIAVLAFQGIMLLVRGAMLIAAAAQWVFNAALFGCPLVWIIAIIAVVIAAIVALVMNWDTVSKWLAAAWEWLKNAAVVTWNAILAFFSAVWSDIKETATMVWTGIQNFLSNTWNSIVAIVTNGINFIVNWITTGWSMVFSAVSSAWSAITSFISNAWNNITNAVRSGASNVLSTVTSIFGNIIGFISGLPGRFFSMGRDLIQGLINGVRAMAGSIASAARSVVEGAVNAAKSALHIGSPSKLFRQFGIWTGQGYVLGIKDENKNVARAGASIALAAIHAINTKPMFKAGLSMGQELAAGIGKASGLVASATGSLTGSFGKVELDASVMANRGAGNNYNITVQAGIGNPEEIGRQAVNAIQAYERVSSPRWRE